MSNRQDREKSPIVWLILFAALVLLISLWLGGIRKADEGAAGTGEGVQVDTNQAAKLLEQVSRDRMRGRRKGHEAGPNYFAPPEGTPAPEEPDADAFPETEDHATSQPIELALLLPPGELRGWVSDSRGDPVVGAAVKLVYEEAVKGGVEPPVPSEKSDFAGIFHIMKIPPGRWTAMAEMKNHATATITGVDIPSGDAPSPITLVLLPEIRLRGVVTAAGKPVPHAMVTASKDQIGVAAQGSVQPVTVVYTTGETGDDGKFELGGLPGGMLKVRIEEEGFATLEEEFELTEKTGEKKFELSAESFIVGLVRGPRGESIAGADLTLYPQGAKDEKANERAATKSTDKGSFGFRALPENRTFDIYAKAPKYSRGGPFPVVSGTRNNVITLTSGGRISGRVTEFSTGDPAASVAVVAVPEGDAGGHALRTTTTSEGLYRLRRLPAGVYTVTVVSETLTGEPKPGIKVATDVSTDNVDLVVYPGMQLSGTVVDGESGERLAGATVAVQSRVGERLLAARKNSATTDSSGDFLISNLPLGIYSVTASLTGYTSGVDTESSARVEMLTRNTPPPVTLKLYRGGSICGRTVDPKGTPVGGALIQIFHAPGSPGRIDTGKLTTTADSQGSFTIEGIPLNQEVQLYASGWAEEHAKGRSNRIVLNRERPSATAEIILGVGSLLDVSVVDSQGARIADANVSISHPDFSGDPAPAAWSTKTDRTGVTVFSHVPPGSVTVSAGKTGYLGKSARVTIGREPIYQETLQLEGAHIISGRVFDDSLTPVVKGKVTARPERGATGSGSDGIKPDSSFRIATVGEGTFMLETEAQRDTATGLRKVTWGMPGIAANDDVGEVRVVVPMSGTLEGRVIVGGADEVPPFNVNLSATYTDAAGKKRPFSAGATFKESDLFSFGDLPPGDYTVTVSANGYLPSTAGTFMLDSPGEIFAGTIRLEPSGGVTYRVINAATKEPIGGVKGVLDPTGAAANTNGDGVATIKPVVPDLYTLTLTHGDYLDKTVELIKVTRGATTDLGQIEMSPGGLLYGKITDGTNEPVAGILVEARAANDDVVRSTRSDGGGAYSMHGLVPGGHLLSFTGKVNGRDVSKSVEVVVAEDRDTEQDVMLWANSSLELTLVGPPDIDYSRALGDLYPLRRNGVLAGPKYALESGGSSKLRAGFLPEGIYIAAIEAPAGNKKVRWAARVNVTGGTIQAIAQAGGNVLRGKLQLSTGAAAKKYDVRLELLSAPHSGIPALANWWRWGALTNSSGKFAFSFLPEGEYSLVAHNESGESDILEIISLPMPPDVPEFVYSFE